MQPLVRVDAVHQRRRQQAHDGSCALAGHGRTGKQPVLAMGPAPDKMKNLHMHHIVREMAPKNWSKKDRGAIYHVQNLAKKYGMTDLNRDPRNFYWARNGGGAHTKKTAHYIRDQLAAASKVGGKDGFFDNIRELGLDAEQGIFNR